ncbi:MAG: tetraacyldisaccharide 4'-kinase [Desulfobacteraceae bacterium]
MLESIEKKLVKKIEAAMAVPVKTDRLFSFNTFLLMVSKVYGLGVKIRTALYRTGVLRSKSLPCFVISIGNITVGGTGKTPMTLYVARLVKQLGYTAAVVSRGYKGGFEEKGGIVSTGKRIVATPEQAGDEPYMLASTLDIPVVVGKSRYKAAMTAVREFHPDVVILDDAFQHLAVKRDLNLLLLDGTSPFGNRALLPRGSLREPLSSVNRVDVVVFTRCSGPVTSASGPCDSGSDTSGGNSGQNDLNAAEKGHIRFDEAVKACLPGGTVEKWFRTSHVPSVCQVLDENGLVLNRKAQETFFSGGRRSGLLFSGIANNDDFKTGCETLGIAVAGSLEFTDHFWYTEATVKEISLAAKTFGADFVVTTHKDFVKLQDISFPLPVVVVTVDIRFDKWDEKQFETLVENRIKSWF